MGRKLSLKDLDLVGKRVLVRVDYNVPKHADGSISDDTRIRASLPTIHALLKGGASVVLMSHMGRPKGKPVASESLKPCAERLSQLLERPVAMAADCIGAETKKMAQGLSPGEVMLLENLRFYAAEEKPDSDPTFAKSLAEMGDCYVNDAFGAAHRHHSSITAITRYFPGKAAAGLLLEKEVRYLGELMKAPEHPFVAVVGGVKVSTKFGVLHSLIERVDTLLIGGAMANTFLYGAGISMGASLVEKDLVGQTREFVERCREKGKNLVLPIDLVVSESSEGDPQTVGIQSGVPREMQAFDIGPETVKRFKEALVRAKTVFWNGPLGMFESKEFAKGTLQIAHMIAGLEATTVIGGGDSVAAVAQAGLSEAMSHLSTGGGASLEFIEKGELPGVEALSDLA